MTSIAEPHCLMFNKLSELAVIIVVVSMTSYRNCLPTYLTSLDEFLEGRDKPCSFLYSSTGLGSWSDLTIGSNERTFWRTPANTGGYVTKYHLVIPWHLILLPGNISTHFIFSATTWIILSTKERIAKGFLYWVWNNLIFSVSLSNWRAKRRQSDDSWHRCSQAFLSHLAKITFFKWFAYTCACILISTM